MYMQRLVRLIVFVAILIHCHLIYAQDTTSGSLLATLKAESAKDIASAISSLTESTLNRQEIARQLTLLLNDDRAVVEHMMGRETVSDRAWFKMLDLPSTAAVSILQELPALESDRTRGRACEVVSRIGKPNRRVYELILSYCDSEDVYLRSRAISALNAVADDSDESVLQLGKLLLDTNAMVKWTVLDALDKRCERIASLLPEIIKLLDDDSDVYIAISNHFSLPEKLNSRVARLLAKIGPRASDARGR